MIRYLTSLINQRRVKKAGRYSAKADELRFEATKCNYAPSKRLLLASADGYDQLAARVWGRRIPDTPNQVWARNYCDER